jgi:hypothetical protein
MGLKVLWILMHLMVQYFQLLLLHLQGLTVLLSQWLLLDQLLLVGQVK